MLLKITNFIEKTSREKIRYIILLCINFKNFNRVLSAGGRIQGMTILYSIVGRIAIMIDYLISDAELFDFGEYNNPPNKKIMHLSNKLIKVYY